MKFFTDNQTACIKATVSLQILKYQDKFEAFKFEGLFHTLIDIDKNLYRIDAIFTKAGYIGDSMEFQEFCKLHSIPIDFSDCI